MGPRRRVLLTLALVLGAGPASPAHAQFGRNKVQYRSFDWQILRTDHFDLHFYPEEGQAATDAARMAERAYGRLSRLLRHEFRERKPLIVYASHAHFQQTNALAGLIGEGTGGVTEILKKRVILPFTGSYADFDHVLTHELVHAFQFDVMVRAGILTERGPVMMERIPLWFMEGMAEYVAIGRVDPHTASWVRDAVVKGYIRSIAEMNVRDDYLSYRFGQSLWAYIGATWGDEVIGTLLQRAPRLGMERAFTSTLGVTLAELSDAWLRSVRKAHLPELVRHAGPDGIATRLTHHETLGDPWYLAPALSPDGTRLVYASQRDGFFMDLWLADATTGEVLDRLVEGSRNAGFESLRYQSSAGAFSPDGRLIAFAAQTGGRDALYLYDVDRRRVVRKLEPELDGVSNPAWSPGGDRLVFTGLSGGTSDLYLTDLSGRVTRLTEDRFAELQPSWSPDGTRIAFSTDRGPGSDLGRLRYGNLRIALLRLGTGEIELLPHQEEGKSINPVWSPDGLTLAWVGDRTGVNNLYRYDLGTRELTRVTDLLTGIIGTNHITPVLSWAREAGRMVFVHFETGGYNLYGIADPRSLPGLERWTDAPPVLASESDAGRTGPGLAQGETRPGHGRPSGEASPGVPPWPDALDPRVADPFTGSLYRRGGTFRESAARVPPDTDERPVSLIELLDSAALELPDTSAFERLDYQVRFTPDVVGRPSLGVQTGGYYGNGVYGGSFITLSDMLGNHHLAVVANVNGSLSDAVFYGGYGFFRSRANVTLAAQQVPFYRYRGTQQFAVDVDGESRQARANVFLRDVIRSVNATVEYPLNTFRRIEIGARAAHFERDHVYRGYFTESGDFLDVEERVGEATFVEPSIALVFDNTLFGWTGPIHGRRYRVQLARTAGGIGFTEGMVDARNYWNHRKRLVLATRLVALVRSGPDSDRFSLYWGGPYFLRGYDGHTYDRDGAECRTPSTPASPSRCPARDQLIGSSAAFLNAEVRVPVLANLRLGPLGQFPPVDGVLFFDGGLAWDERVCQVYSPAVTSDCAGDARPVRVVWDRDPDQDPFLFREPLFSYGFGLRFNVFYAILRLDYAFPLNRDRTGVFSIAFGPSF